MGKIFDALFDALAEAERRGETRYAIAQRTGVSQSTLSRIANRQAESLNVATLERLVDALGVEVTLRPKRSRG